MTDIFTKQIIFKIRRHTFMHLFYFLFIFISYRFSILNSLISISIDLSTLSIIDLIDSIRYYIDTKRIKLKCSRCRKFKRKTEFICLFKLLLQDISNIIENRVKFNGICNACSNIIKIYEQNMSRAKVIAKYVAKDIEYTAAITS